MRESPSEAWARCSPYLERALARTGDGETLPMVEQAITEERAWFWPTAKSAAVMQITKDCHFWLAGGDLGDLLSHYAEAERWAAQHGCDRMTLRGRPGWQRTLAPLGFRPLTYLVKDLP
jgi:hypothetical protein